MASEQGTVIHRADVSTLPPPLQPAWKAAPGAGGDRLAAIGGDMFSPIKLQQLFHAPAAGPAPFTFRAERSAVTSSTPMPRTRPRTHAPPPSTPGGPHVPLRLFDLKNDARVRSGLEQLVEAHDENADTSQLSDASSHPMRTSKRLRVHSSEHTPSQSTAWLAPGHASSPRPPLAYRSTNTDSLRVRSILKSAPERHEGRTPSRSISFADDRPSLRTTPRTARLEHVLAELEELEVTHDTTPRPRAAPADADQTALSQASFRIARHRLVELLTDIAPWEPDWAALRRVDLRARRLDTCIGLAEYTPHAEEVWLDHNRVAFAIGLPHSVRVLTASHNCFSDLASFAHLQHLQVLDVSANELHSLVALADLPNLVEIRADQNQVTHLHGLERLERLEKVSLQDNVLGGTLPLDRMHWPRVEELHLARNAVTELAGLGTLPMLHTLDVEDNALTRLAPAERMPQLRVLRVSGNARMHSVEMRATPRLRTLYADRCSLGAVAHLGTAHALERLSLRQQHTALAFPLANPPLLQRLFLSGNAVPGGALLRADAPELVYLELAGCQLTHLSDTTPRQTPALRTLNLDHNPMCIPRLSAWPNLKRVSCVGARTPTLEALVQAVDSHPTLCVMDARMNACTLGLYPPVLLPVGTDPAEEEVLPPVPHPAIVQPDAAAAMDAAAAAQRAEAQALADRSQFHKRSMLVPPEPGHDRPAPRHRAVALFGMADERFAATLPASMARKRAVYRGLCGMACPTLTWLDGLTLTDADVACAERYVAQAR